jgi:anti-sigma-K factor RskA
MSDEQRNPQHEPWRERFDDLKGAYALGALTEDERREFEGYLEAHPGLQAEAEDLGSTASLLALAPQEYHPPPELRRNLLGSIEDATGATITGGSSRLAKLWELFGSGGLIAAAVAAVAILAVVGLFLWNASLQGQNEDLRGAVQDRRTYELQGSGAARDARGQVVGVGDGRAVLLVNNLPPAPEGEVYEAWLQRDGVPEPAGLFQAGGEESAATNIEDSIKGADAVQVTVEPSSGSSTPTSNPLLTAAL